MGLLSDLGLEHLGRRKRDQDLHVLADELAGPVDGDQAAEIRGQEKGPYDDAKHWKVKNRLSSVPERPLGRRLDDRHQNRDGCASIEADEHWQVVQSSAGPRHSDEDEKVLRRVEQPNVRRGTKRRDPLVGNPYALDYECRQGARPAMV